MTSMKTMKCLLVVLCLALLGSANAAPSKVKFSTTGNGVFDVTGIVEFDWQSTGDLVIVNALPFPQSITGGGTVTTFADWASSASVGDSVTFNFHAHARMVRMIGGTGGIPVGKLSDDGVSCPAGSGCFEITTAISGLESATLTAPGVIRFDSVVANYKFFFNSPPDSNVIQTANPPPTNFTNGVAFLEGTAVAVSGSYNSVQTPPGGSELMENTVSSYNPNYIQADTPGLVQINASTFDNLISLKSTLDDQIVAGQPAGLQPYIVVATDQLYKVDSNTEFGALPEQQSGICRVTGGGNDVDENLVIHKDNVNIAFPNSAVLLPGYTFNPLMPNRYTYGGQVGAPGAVGNNVGGEWTHHQMLGQTADFVFHAGTHSAPKDTVITTVQCSDPEACKPAVANASFKQIDFEGTGSFRTIKKGQTINGFPAVVDSDPAGTRHYFRAHIEDLGEPGGAGGPKPNSCNKKPGAFANKAQCKNCPDIYQIEIHATTDKNSAIIYTVGAYVDGGNLQIHPPVKK